MDNQANVVGARPGDAERPQESGAADAGKHNACHFLLRLRRWPQLPVEPVARSGFFLAPLGVSLPAYRRSGVAYWSLRMRSRRLAAARLLRTARFRRAGGTILVLLGTLLWVIAILSPIPFEPSLWVISGGALVVGGIILIATSV